MSLDLQAVMVSKEKRFVFLCFSLIAFYSFIKGILECFLKSLKFDIVLITLFKTKYYRVKLVRLAQLVQKASQEKKLERQVHSLHFTSIFNLVVLLLRHLNILSKECIQLTKKYSFFNSSFFFCLSISFISAICGCVLSTFFFLI